VTRIREKEQQKGGVIESLRAAIPALG